MKLHHIAIWTFRLEELKEFYVRFLGGKSNEKYVNPKKGFESYFISFGEGPSSRCTEYGGGRKQSRIDTSRFHVSRPGGSSSFH